MGRQLPPLKVRTQSGALVTVGGTIDRVDVYRSPGGKEYVRVIDYKTGNKVFQLSDVLYGLNMQMLVYLAALVEAGDDLPAGVLYLPAAEPSVSVDRGGRAPGGEEGRRPADAHERRGAGGHGDHRGHGGRGQGDLIPASLNKDGTPSKNSAVLTGRQLETVLAYSKKLIAALGDKLLEGRVEAKPHMKNRNACKFCPYGPVLRSAAGPTRTWSGTGPPRGRPWNRWSAPSSAGKEERTVAERTWTKSQADAIAARRGRCWWPPPRAPARPPCWWSGR